MEKRPELVLGRSEAGDTRSEEDLEKLARAFMSRIDSILKPEFGRKSRNEDAVRSQRDETLNELAEELSQDVWLTREVFVLFWKDFSQSENMEHDVSFEELALEPRWKRKLRHPSKGLYADVYEVAKRAIQKLIASPKTKPYERQVARLYMEGIEKAENDQDALSDEMRFGRPANEN